MGKIKFRANLINSYRAYIFLGIVLLFGLLCDNFFSLYNIKSILSSTALYTFIGLGFTTALIAGHFDLSVGYMATTGAICALGMKTLAGLPWGAAILIAVVLGMVVGTVNGLLIAKAKINSFITTLGMQFVLKGGMYVYCNGAEISVNGDYGLTDKLSSVPVSWLPFNVFFMITLFFVIVFAIVLAKTRFGRNVSMLGGNLETAWLAGIDSDKVTIFVFMLSSTICSLGGALFGIYQGTATPTLGEKGIAPLMIALTATIIGGTDIAGGKGKVTDTFVSIIAILAMFGVVTPLFGKSAVQVQILLIGFVLAVCVIYETLVKYRKLKTIGMRPNLVIKYMEETGNKKLKGF